MSAMVDFVKVPGLGATPFDASLFVVDMFDVFDGKYLATVQLPKAGIDKVTGDPKGTREEATADALRAWALRVCRAVDDAAHAIEAGAIEIRKGEAASL